MKPVTQTLLILSVTLASTALSGLAHADTMSLGNFFRLDVKDASLFNSASANIGESANFLVGGQQAQWRPEGAGVNGEYCEIHSSKRFFTGDRVRMAIIETDDRLSATKPGTYDHRFTASSMDGTLILECQVLEATDKNFVPTSDVNIALGKAASINVLQ